MPEPRSDSFLGHLEALRRTLLACLAAWALALPAGWSLAPGVVDGLQRWCLAQPGLRLHFFSPLEVFLVQFKTGAVLAALLSFPYASHRLWRFLLPGLEPRERRLLRRWFLAAMALFLAGCAFCLLGVLPLLMRFAAAFASERMVPLLGISQFVDLAGILILAFGILFQIPVWVCLSVRFGHIPIAAWRSVRPYVLVGILVLAAIFTPPDVLSQVLLALPAWLLFELGLLVAGRGSP